MHIVHVFGAAAASAVLSRHAYCMSPFKSCHLHSKSGCLVEYSQKRARPHRSSSSISGQVCLRAPVNSSYLVRVRLRLRVRASVRARLRLRVRASVRAGVGVRARVRAGVRVTARVRVKVEGGG